VEASSPFCAGRTAGNYDSLLEEVQRAAQGAGLIILALITLVGLGGLAIDRHDFRKLPATSYGTTTGAVGTSIVLRHAHGKDTNKIEEGELKTLWRWVQLISMPRTLSPLREKGLVARSNG
jgi:hypothetical protein